MTDTTETIVTPDPHAIARAVCSKCRRAIMGFRYLIYLEITSLTSLRREYPCYEDGNVVTLYHDENRLLTVNESSLIPTEDALMPPNDSLKIALTHDLLPPIRSYRSDDERIEKRSRESSLQSTRHERPTEPRLINLAPPSPTRIVPPKS